MVEGEHAHLQRARALVVQLQGVGGDIDAVGDRPPEVHQRQPGNQGDQGGDVLDLGGTEVDLVAPVVVGEHQERDPQAPEPLAQRGQARSAQGDTAATAGQFSIMASASIVVIHFRFRSSSVISW